MTTDSSTLIEGKRSETRRPGCGIARATAALFTFLVLATLSCGDGTEPPPPDPPRPTTVTVRPASARLTALGDSVRFTAEVRDQYGNVMTAATVSWSTSDAAVAMVNASGVATAASAGAATITATSGNASGSATVTVEREVSVVIVTPDEAALAPGDTVTLHARAEDANGFPIEDAVFAWSSGDTGVATVDTTGLVHAVGEGSATITATSGNASGSATVTVVDGSQRMALEALYRSTGGEEWIKQDNWLTDAPLREWYGVTARQDQVVGLEMIGNNLNGAIPPQIEHLTSLRRISLHDNVLSGEIPPELGNLSNLYSLQLSNNTLSGSIPPELGRLDGLGFLHLSTNNLSGEIPPEIGRLTSLQVITLAYNDLSGEIPPELGNLAELWSMDLRGNRLQGPIPQSFLRLGLQTFWFIGPNRNIDLCLPGTPEFIAWATRASVWQSRYCNESDVVALRSLYQATGGTDWMNSGGWPGGPTLAGLYGVRSDTLGRVVALDLQNNGLSGELPSQLGHLSAMTELRIGGNALTGRLPLSLMGVPLRELHYADTELCAPADAAFQAWLTTIGTHEGSGVECDALTNREILTILYRATDGPNWDFSNNWLTEEPLRDWYGVSVDSQGRVVALILTYNNPCGGHSPGAGPAHRP